MMITVVEVLLRKILLIWNILEIYLSTFMEYKIFPFVQIINTIIKKKN